MIDEVVVEFVACLFSASTPDQLRIHRTRTVLQDQPNQVFGHNDLVETSNMRM